MRNDTGRDGRGGGGEAMTPEERLTMIKIKTNGFMARQNPFEMLRGDKFIKCPNCKQNIPLLIDIIEDGDKHICNNCWKNIKITLTSEVESDFDRGYSGSGKREIEFFMPSNKK